MKPYPTAPIQDIKDTETFLRFITRERANDIIEFNNIQSTFMSGRRVGRIPASSSDVIDGDKVNDFSYNAVDGYLYMLGNNAGTAEWRRIQLVTF